jgi:DNA polymerase III alpha subunit
VCGFLRHYYPLEFLTAAFNTFTGKEDKIVAITKYANKVGVKILPPKFRYSRSGYQMDKSTNSIYKGLESIKYMNADVSEELYKMKDQQFNSFIDLIKVFPGNSRQLGILIELGFFEEFGKTQKLLRIVDLYNKYGGKKQIKKDKCDIPEEIISKYSTSTAAMYKLTDVDGMLKELIADIPDKDIPLQVRLNSEREYLGYISYTDTSRPNAAVVMDINTKYSTFKIQLYQLSTGQTITAKLKKSAFEKNPFLTGNVMNIRIEKKNKWRIVNGEWETINEYEDWLSWYTVIE